MQDYPPLFYSAKRPTTATDCFLWGGGSRDGPELPQAPTLSMHTRSRVL